MAAWIGESGLLLYILEKSWSVIPKHTYKESGKIFVGRTGF